MAVEHEKFELIVKKIEPNATLTKAWNLKGGISAEMTALEARFPDGHIQKMIVRRPGERARIRNPNIAADEFKILQTLRAAGVRAQTAYFLDESKEIFSDSYIVIEYLEGSTNYVPQDVTKYVAQIATQLAKIHYTDVTNLTSLPKQEQRLKDKIENRPLVTDDSLQESQIRDALEKVWPLTPRNKESLLHGDFWPGNLLWNNDELIAVIDWEDAELGEPLSDFAITRQDMLLIFGLDAMNTFTERYTSIAELDYKDLPYWDLVAALRPASQITDWAKDWRDLGRNDITEQTMRDAHKLFVAQAFEKLTM